MSEKAKYEILTWDADKQDFTPHQGVRRGPYTQFGLRKAMRRLQALGYPCNRGDPSVLIQRLGAEAEPGLCTQRAEGDGG